MTPTHRNCPRPIPLATTGRRPFLAAILLLGALGSQVIPAQIVVPLPTPTPYRDTAKAAKVVSQLMDQYGPESPTAAWPQRKILADWLDATAFVPAGTTWHPLTDPVVGPFLGHLFRTRCQKVLHDLDTVQVPVNKLRVFKLYSSCTVLKSNDRTIAFDFAEGPFPILGLPGITPAFFGNLADRLDALFVSHVHADHFSVYLIAEMLARQKPVIAPQQVVNILLGNGYFWAGAITVPTTGLGMQTVAGIPFYAHAGRQWLSFINNDPRTPNVALSGPDNLVYALRMGGRFVAHFGDENDIGVLPWFSLLDGLGVRPTVLIQPSILIEPLLVSALQPSEVLQGHEWEFTHVGPQFVRLNTDAFPNPARRVLMWGDSIQF